MGGTLLLLRAAALLALAFGGAFLLRRASAARRADLWRATFLALALLPAASVVLPRLPVLPGVVRGAAQPLRLAHGALPQEAQPGDARVELAPAADTGVHARSMEHAAGRAREFDAGADPAPATPGGAASRWWWRAAAALWVAGSGLLLLRLARGWLHARGIARRARPLGREGGLDVALSEETAATFLWDPRPFGPPRVVFAPGDAEGPARTTTLLHERAHLARRDGAVLPLAAAVAALLWPTLLVRVALRRLQLETERAADDAVLRAGVLPSAYAARLVALVSHPASLPVPGMARGSVTARVRTILDPHADRRATGRAGRAAMALLLCGAASCAATAVAQEGATTDAPTPPASDGDGPLARGLDALVELQSEAGAWRGDVGYKLNNGWRVTAPDVAHVGVTGLAVEALVRAGVTLDGSPRGEALARGIAFLRASQNAEGFLTASGSRLRAHAHGMTGLSAALRVDDDPELGEAVARALRFSLAARGEESGLWRFTPGSQDVDVLEVAHNLVACRAAFAALDGRNAEFEDEMARVEERARQFAESVRVSRLGFSPEYDGNIGFRYQPAEASRMTWNTTLAGLAILGPRATFEDQGTFLVLLDRLDRTRTGWRSHHGGAAGHFLVWDAELLGLRAIGEGVPYDSPVLVRADGTTPAEDVLPVMKWNEAFHSWKRGTLSWLEDAPRPDGTWPCAVGIGDAYSTAVGCLLAAAGG